MKKNPAPRPSRLVPQQPARKNRLISQRPQKKTRFFPRGRSQNSYRRNRPKGSYGKSGSAVWATPSGPCLWPVSVWVWWSFIINS